MASLELVTANGVNIQLSGDKIIVQIPDFESPACSQYIEIPVSEWDSIVSFVTNKIKINGNQ